MRLFLAIELEPALRRRVAELQERLRASCAGWRWVRPEGVHLTVRFLGEADPEVDRAARDGWRRAAAECAPFDLRLAGVGTFPPRGRPRVLWVGAVVGAGGRALEELAAAVEREARWAGFEPETRPFRGHLTLGRAPRRERVAPPPEVAFEAGPMRVERLVLFSSRLTPAGARYTALDSWPLSAEPAGAGETEDPR